MGFLIFAYRKLFLKRKINDLNYQSMVLSQKKQQITNQIGAVQQSISNAKSAISLFTNSALASAQKEVYGQFYDVDDKGKATLKQDVDQTQMYSAMNAKTQGIIAASQYTNSLFEASDQSQLAYLNQLDSQISMQIANIDSQTKQLMPELESVEKAEDQAAKSEAPKFGLS